jgi:transcriptional regulator with XRE-family HTH domain
MKQKKVSNIDQYVIDKEKENREKMKLSQADLVLQLEVSLGFIGSVESSKHRPKYNLTHLNELAKIFNCSPQDFLPKKPM